MKNRILFTSLFITIITFKLFSQLGVTPTLAATNVPESSQYGVLYQVDLNASGAFSNLNAVNYAINNSNLALNYTRVAYFMQLDNKWVWVSMNRFNTTNAELGLPYNGSNIVWQQTVTAMNVYGSSNAGVTSTLNSSGNIEIWSDCYVTNNMLSGIGGNSGNYDFNDTRNGSNNCYGSFQVHNWAAQQTLFGLNNFAGGGTYDLGIGNNPGSHPDWTFQNNANTYTTRKLWILVNNGVFIATPPSVANVNACLNATLSALTVPLNFAGMAGAGRFGAGQMFKSLMAPATKAAYKPINTVNQYKNYFYQGLVSTF